MADSRRRRRPARPPAEEAVHFPATEQLGKEETRGELVVEMGLVMVSVVNGLRPNGLMGRNGKKIL